MTTKLTRSMPIGSVLLLASLMLLILGCGGVQGTILDAPANQRYWHESGSFAVLHWDAVPDAERYEIYYFRAACSQGNWCRAESLGETPSTSAAIYIDMGLYSIRCDEGPVCSFPLNTKLDLPPEDAADKFHDFRVATCTSVGCSDVETINPAQRLDSPDGSLPDTPMGFQAEKFDRRNAVDDAQITWEPVHGASSYEIWVSSDPSSEFRLGLRVRSHGLVPWENELGDVPAEAMLHVEPYVTPTNRGTFGEYNTTSWKLRACTDAGCSPFTELLTVN